MFVFWSVKISVKKWSKTLKQREFNEKLEIKDMIKVRLALDLSVNLILSL